MTHVTCRLTAKNRNQLRNPTLCNRVWATFTLFLFAFNFSDHPVNAWMLILANCSCTGLDQTLVSIFPASEVTSAITARQFNLDTERDQFIEVGFSFIVKPVSFSQQKWIM